MSSRRVALVMTGLVGALTLVAVGPGGDAFGATPRTPEINIPGFHFPGFPRRAQLDGKDGADGRDGQGGNRKGQQGGSGGAGDDLTHSEARQIARERAQEARERARDRF